MVKKMKMDRSSQRPLVAMALVLALAVSGWVGGAQAWGGGTLELTVLEEGLRTSCLANVITSLGCTQPDLGGTQGCADPKPRTVAGSGAGGAIDVRGFNFDFGARRRGAKPGLQLSDLVRRDLQGEVAGALRAQYRGRRAAPSIDGELGTSDFGDSGLLADLFGTTNVGALTFTKLPDASSAALFELSAGRWMNITDYEGADDCYRLPMVYLEFNLPTNISSSSALVVKAEGVVTGFKFVYEAAMEGHYVEEVKVAVNCVGYALATASNASPTLATLNNGAYFNATFVTGIPHCSDS